ncbi:hypothetical protein AAG596_09520 [Citromicrobium bathyomarinum]|uniref:hypothetical protein n=1 Tax=Citromicrobium bathyomarinum TaxID=72174 RepID=UPI00315AC93C
MSLIGMAIDRLFPPPPRMFEHPEIGRLEQDRHRPNCYTGAVDWPLGAAHGGQITLILHGDKPTRGGLKNAAQHFLAMRANAQHVVAKAADCAGAYLYPKWRDEWFGDEEETPIDAWKAGLEIERIWVDPLGQIGIDYRFNQPFEGHHATVSGVAPDRFEYASLTI